MNEERVNTVWKEQLLRQTIPNLATTSTSATETSATKEIVTKATGKIYQKTTQYLSSQKGEVEYTHLLQQDKYLKAFIVGSVLTGLSLLAIKHVYQSKRNWVDSETGSLVERQQQYMNITGQSDSASALRALELNRWNLASALSDYYVETHPGSSDEAERDLEANVEGGLQSEQTHHLDVGWLAFIKSAWK